MTGKLFKLLFIMVLGLCTSLLLLASGSVLAETTPIQITDDPTFEGRPDVSNNAIVWKRLSLSSGWDIYRTGSEEPVTDAPGNQINPMTNGIYVIWEDWSSGESDIYMKVALPLSQIMPLVASPGNQAILSVSGNRLVYVNNADPLPCNLDNPAYPNCPDTGENDVNNDIYAVDLDNPGNPYPVSTEAGSQWQPRISGNKVVWQDYRNGNWDIYMKDILESGDGVPVTMGLSDDKVADISGDIIVWRSYRNNQYDIWMKDVSPSGGAEVPVTNDAFYQNSPRISGDLVVWEDYRNDSNPADDYYNYDIYMKDLTSGIESMLAGGLPIQARPAVDNETVVWEDTTSGNYDIWMATVPDLTAPVINDLTPASGQSAGCAFPAIQASFTDNRVGVDTASVSLIVDGEDVTALSAISDQSILYQPPSMAGGQHSATVTVADLSGNSTSSSWQFDITRPVMGLDALVVYWASYDDYLDHKLSVPYQLFNPSVEITNYSVEILASQTTGGVILSTAGMPIWLGDIAPGNHGDTILKYLVPPNISTFKTTISASSLDACGSSYNFPGPPPEW